MQLTFIKTTACPKCGCKGITNESIEYAMDGKIREHTYGGYWETRHFSCGFRTRYIPNFSREEHYGECENDPDIISRNEKRKKASVLLINYIDTLDIDNDFKKILMVNIR